ncbi:MAG: substrate-binding domain-containing protein [Lachnospiraceae bacterium]|nr:substrate-binding domain-containing protein [Lachnospiraceae bacterium]
MKRKVVKRVVSSLMVASMATLLLAGCGSSDSSTTEETTDTDVSEAAAETSDTEASSDSGDASVSTVYSFARNQWSSGAYPQESSVHCGDVFLGYLGMEQTVENNEAVMDQVVSDIQSLIASGPDGLLLMNVFQEMFASCTEALDAGDVPYVWIDDIMTDEDVLASIVEDPLFAGWILPDSYQMGYEMGTLAGESGLTKAIILSAGLTDDKHVKRTEGFTDAFEAAGGEILQVVHCDDPSQATERANDLISANPDAEIVFCSGGEYTQAACGVVAGDDSNNMVIYGTDILPDCLDYIKSGECIAISGGNQICGAVGYALLINYLDGHPILDEDGNCAIIDDLQPYTVDASNVDVFEALYAEESCFVTEDQLKNLLWRYNEDVSLETFEEFAQNYPDYVMEYAGLQ